MECTDDAVTPNLDNDHNVVVKSWLQHGPWEHRLDGLYSANVIAKVTRTAIESLGGNVSIPLIFKCVCSC